MCRLCGPLRGQALLLQFSAVPHICVRRETVGAGLVVSPHRREGVGTNAADLIVFGVFGPYDRKVKISVDGKICGSIIRPTSGAVETEKPLRFNELQRFLQFGFAVRFSLPKPRSS